MMPAMLPAINIADFFIRAGSKDKAPISHMKLQFLLFIAQGAYMAMHQGEELFSANFEKWSFGPVCPEVYEHFKDSQTKPLENPANPSIDIADGPIRNFLEWIWVSNRQFTSEQLLEQIRKDFPMDSYPLFEVLPNKDLEMNSVRRVIQQQ